MDLEKLINLSPDDLERRMRLAESDFKGKDEHTRKRMIRERLEKFEDPLWQIMIYLAKNYSGAYPDSVAQFALAGGEAAIKHVEDGLKEYCTYTALLKKADYVSG